MVVIHEDDHAVIGKTDSLNNNYCIQFKHLGIEAGNSLLWISNNAKDIGIINVVVDWNHCDGLCSHLMTWIYQLDRSIRELKGDVVHINISKNTKMELSVGNELRLLKHFDTNDEALAYLRNVSSLQ